MLCALFFPFNSQFFFEFPFVPIPITNRKFCNSHWLENQSFGKNTNRLLFLRFFWNFGTFLKQNRPKRKKSEENLIKSGKFGNEDILVDRKLVLLVKQEEIRSTPTQNQRRCTFQFSQTMGELVKWKETHVLWSTIDTKGFHGQVLSHGVGQKKRNEGSRQGDVPHSVPAVSPWSLVTSRETLDSNTYSTTSNKPALAPSKSRASPEPSASSFVSATWGFHFIKINCSMVRKPSSVWRSDQVEEAGWAINWRRVIIGPSQKLDKFPPNRYLIFLPLI